MQRQHTDFSTPSSGGLTGGPGGTTSPTPAACAPEAAASIDALALRCRVLERSVARQRVLIDELRNHVGKLEELFSKSQTELAYSQQQLEYVVVSLERERGIVIDHTEQLRLFAGESRGRGGADTGSQGTVSMLLVIGNWLYMPVVHFAKGIYTVLSPIINTAQSLSLFNSEVLQRFADEQLHARWGKVRNSDLLVKLQKGTLDPPSVSARRMSS